LGALESGGIKTCGAGLNKLHATSPAVVEVSQQPQQRVLVFSYGTGSAGVYPEWEATEDKPGVSYLTLDLSQIPTIRDTIAKYKQSGDIVFSVHWGGNWGFKIEEERRQFAKKLIEEAHVDLVHGHSSHHAVGLEVWNNKLIIYGAGDFLSDYEGIQNPAYEGYRDDLALMYFPELSPETGELMSLKMVPTLLKNLRVNAASQTDANFLFDMLNEQGKKFGTSVKWTNSSDNCLELQWTRTEASSERKIKSTNKKPTNYL